MNSSRLLDCPEEFNTDEEYIMNTSGEEPRAERVEQPGKRVWGMQLAEALELIAPASDGRRHAPPRGETGRRQQPVRSGQAAGQESRVPS